MIRKIFMYWHSGFFNAPDVVRACLVSWKVHHYNWEIILLDDNNIEQYVNPNIKKFQFLPKCHFADILRLRLLNKYGGVWADTTTFVTCSLDHWLPTHLLKQQLFMFEKPGPDRLISNWFIYADPKHPVIQKWLSACESFWMKHKINNDYFIHHHIFGNLYNTDPQFRKLWNETSKVSASEPHIIQTFGLNCPPPSQFHTIIHNKKFPIYKLSHKINNPLSQQTVIGNVICLQYVLIGLDRFPVFDLLLHKSVFIHIGKCGGTFVRKVFADNAVYIEEVHVSKVHFSPEKKYIIWIRNPLSRFVSAFNYVLALLHTDTSKYTSFSLDNSLAPGILTRKKITGFTISPSYDELIKFFKTPNQLAESLYNGEHTEKAHQLMSMSEEHLQKGIGWYLDNGDFIDKHHSNILFVGRMEHMEEDINKLSSLIGFQFQIHHKDKVRENRDTKCNTFLSDKAQSNLRRFLHNTDYKALYSLHKYRLISDHTMIEYIQY